MVSQIFQARIEGHPDLLRQSIYSRLAGYEDPNDAGRLSQDPTFRLIGSEKIWERGHRCLRACKAKKGNSR
jgi:hypothetical protein